MTKTLDSLARTKLAPIAKGTRLMPMGSYRWCKLSSCGCRWYTANPTAQACPYCGELAKDASEGWPHMCARGHDADHGGMCVRCAKGES